MSTLNRVIFLSQVRAEAMRPPRDAALISVTDSNAPEASLAGLWPQVLRVSFDDVDPIGYPVDHEEQVVPISDDQALELAEFVVRVSSGCRRLVVHCRYGMSRSAAIAKAVCEHHELYFPPWYSDQNDFVYRAVARAPAQRRQ